MGPSQMKNGFQLQSIAIVASIFTTVVLALERCLAVAKPIEYHNAVQVSLLMFFLKHLSIGWTDYIFLCSKERRRKVSWNKRSSNEWRSNPTWGWERGPGGKAPCKVLINHIQLRYVTLVRLDYNFMDFSSKINF